jgi:hypothetical protein
MCKKAVLFVSFVLVLCLTSSVSAELVAYWTFDEASGDIVADSTGNGNDGTIFGAQRVEGKYGTALEFNGADNYVDVPTSDSLEIETNVSIAAWINWVDAGDGWLAIMANGQQGGPWENYGLFVNRGGGYLYFTLSLDGGHVTQSTPNNAIQPDEWLHACATWDGSNARIYVNGEMVLEQAQSGQLVPPQLPLRIGHRDGSSHFFNGIIDDVRVYNHTLIEEEILAAMEGGEGYPYALGPVPKDGALHLDTWASISWLAGSYAVTHDVYLGDNFDDVDSGAESTFRGNQADTFFVAGFPGFPFPDGLVPGTTYFWRIDEVNDAEPNSPWKGDVWSFSIPPKTAYFPDPADGAESVGVDGTLSWTAGFGAKLHTPYFGETFDEVDNATGGMAQGTTTFAPDTLKMAKTYYWRVDEFDVVETHKGSVWSFTTEGAVGSPNPANGAVDVTQTPTLTWAPGLGASHEVYFGADAASLELKGSGNLGSESFESGQLEWNTTYYWHVDEANNANADSPWTGPLWSFTTANFLIIDDFENYNDLDPAEPGSNRIFLAWIDGFDNPAVNGSVVGYANPPFAEQTIVNSGSQSMPFAYDNTVGKSEATLSLTSNRDWTVKGVNTLTIWYRGNTSNAAETMYVMLNGSAGVDNDNPDAATINNWTEWNIDLQAFADQGVNLANVTSITLGLRSVTGGTGMLYFDDIRLYPPIP